MSTVVYCTRADVEQAWTAANLLAAVDDDADDVISVEEEAIVTRAIQRAANRMNARLELRYALESLASNAWCRDCNAAIAVYLLATRRDEEASAAILEQYKAYLADLDAVAGGRMKVPNANESHEHSPTVSNFRADLRVPLAPTQCVSETSTGAAPPSALRSRS